MSDVFISYARSTEKQAQQVAAALRALGYGVWRDDDLPAHRDYSEVIDERLAAARAVVVIWSSEAVKSQWVQSEADTARTDGKLVQLTVDGSRLPRPFDRIQCADLAGWTGNLDAPGWRKVVASIGDLVGGTGAAPVSVASPSVADTPLPLPTKPSIAVMPFANLSGDPEQEYFADGMVEEITNALSRFKSLFVIASSSTLSFKGKAVGAQEAARQLGVRCVLTGSVRKAGNRVRIAVQLIDAADGSQIWTNRFEDTLEDVFELQDKVALSVASVIEPTVHAADVRRASRRPTENMGSYDLYLRARALRQNNIRKADTLEALDLLNRAIAIDPDFGQALALAGWCHHTIFLYGWSDDPEANRRQMIELSQRALKVAEDDADVLAGRALMLGTFEADRDTALNLINKAVALNPSSSFVWQMSGFSQLRSNPDLAAEHIETAMRLDPIGSNRGGLVNATGQVRFAQQRFSEAAPLFKEFVQLTNSPVGYAFLAASCGHLGRIDEAKSALARYRELSSRQVEHVLQGASARASSGSFARPSVTPRFVGDSARAIENGSYNLTSIVSAPLYSSKVMRHSASPLAIAATTIGRRCCGVWAGGLLWPPFGSS
ncbi:MAG TPA: TIR domain-containing protein [Caulobacteraceae bacterium]|nr:TIR domain-containing protein [Caulobacteraceae bacterium]